MENKFRSQNKGFVGVVFLAIALIGIVVAAIASMSRESASGTSRESAKMQVSVLLKQASDIKNGFDRMVIDGRVARPHDITIDTNATTGLFSTAQGPAYSVAHIPPRQLGPDVLINAAGFNYNIGVKLPGIGGMVGTDYMITTQIKELSTCQIINKLLYGDSITALPAVSGSNKAMWAAKWGTFADADTSINYYNRAEGCVRVSGPEEYAYYKVLFED